MDASAFAFTWVTDFPLLEYHAGMIAAAVGDAARARTDLSEAISLDGALDPVAAQRASAALAGLR